MKKIFAVIGIALIAGLSLLYVGRVPGEGGAETRDTVEALVFFGNEKLDPENTPDTFDCGRVFPVTRRVARQDALIENALLKAALDELVKGPTPAEKKEGYISLFSNETAGIVKDARIKNQTAYIDLQDIRQTLASASASCGGAFFLASFEKTAEQFSGIDRLIFAIDGDPRAFYEWLQFGCGPENDECDPSPFRAAP